MNFAFLLLLALTEFLSTSPVSASSAKSQCRKEFVLVEEEEEEELLGAALLQM